MKSESLQAYVILFSMFNDIHRARAAKKLFSFVLSD